MRALLELISYVAVFEACFAAPTIVVTVRRGHRRHTRRTR
jgi:hypothetical protein